MKINKVTIVIVFLIIIILIQLFVLIFRPTHRDISSQNRIEKLEEKIRKNNDSIVFWQKQSEIHQLAVKQTISKIDSLQKLKPIIKKNHEKIYNSIPSSSNKQLDSIIRSNW